MNAARRHGGSREAAAGCGRRANRSRQESLAVAARDSSVSGGQSGFGLIEVLITVLVISAGLLAYVSLQRSVFREANLASAQVAATELALSKLEDLRGFSALNTTTGQFAYQDIAANAGGGLASGTVVLENLTLSRSWTVTNYWYTDVNLAPVTAAPAGNPLPSFKLVTVTIAWTDHNGSAQTLSLPSIIAATDPRLAATVFY